MEGTSQGSGRSWCSVLLKRRDADVDQTDGGFEGTGVEPVSGGGPSRLGTLSKLQSWPN